MGLLLLLLLLMMALLMVVVVGGGDGGRAGRWGGCCCCCCCSWWWWCCRLGCTYQSLCFQPRLHVYLRFTVYGIWPSCCCCVRPIGESPNSLRPSKPVSGIISPFFRRWRFCRRYHVLRHIPPPPHPYFRFAGAGGFGAAGRPHRGGVPPERRDLHCGVLGVLQRRQRDRIHLRRLRLPAVHQASPWGARKRVAKLQE